MKLNEIIDLYKDFELGVKVKDREVPDTIKGYQLEKYFFLDDTKIEKNKNITIYFLYRHNKSGEIIRIKGAVIEPNEKYLYRNYTNREVIKEFMFKKELPHQCDKIRFNYELVEE